MFCQCDLLLISLPYTHLAHYNNIQGTMFCQCDLLLISLPYTHLPHYNNIQGLCFVNVTYY